jgi:hypothetical protein
MTTQPAQHPERHHRWWKRPIPVVLVLSAGVLGLLLVPSTTQYHRMGGRCNRCYVSFSTYKLELFGIRVIDRYRANYRGTPELKAAQARCTHPEYGGGGRSGSLSPLGATRIGDSFAYMGAGPTFTNMLEVEGPAAMSTLFEPHFLDMWRNATATQDEPPLARWAWFMQQVTGEDFGVSYDDKADVPVLPDDAIDRINAWWEEEGVAGTPNQNGKPKSPNLLHHSSTPPDGTASSSCSPSPGLPLGAAAVISY